MANDTSIELWRQYRAGDAAAADAIHARYVEGLIGLAARRLSARVARRADAEDVVQSAYRSFFVRARDGAFRIERSGDLWRLLATITVKKVLGNVERHRAAGRDVNREYVPDPWLLERLGQQPSPDDLAVAAEQLQLLMTGLSAEQRQALEMRLQDFTYEEIAERIGRTERTVRRWITELKSAWERRSAASDE